MIQEVIAFRGRKYAENCARRTNNGRLPVSCHILQIQRRGKGLARPRPGLAGKEVFFLDPSADWPLARSLEVLRLTGGPAGIRSATGVCQRVRPCGQGSDCELVSQSHATLARQLTVHQKRAADESFGLKKEKLASRLHRLQVHTGQNWEQPAFWCLRKS